MMKLNILTVALASVLCNDAVTYAQPAVDAGQVLQAPARTAVSQSAQDVRGPAGVVPLSGEPPAKLIIDPPLAAPLARGRVVIQYRAENLRIEQVFGAAALDVSPRIGHIHVTVDDVPWHWLDASGEPLTITGLTVGPHKVLIELVNANHQTLDYGVVNVEVPQRSLVPSDPKADGFRSAPAIAQATSPVTKINDEAAKAEITVQSLRGNISVLMGSGGNITVLTGPDGKLLVDAGIAVSRPRVEAALNSIGQAPLKYLINTHWHWDHTDGNEWVHDLGATIIAQENTLKRLSTTTRVEDWNYTFQTWPISARPSVTFKTGKTLKFDGETIVLKSYGPGHTDSDITVYFTKADVMALGDIWWNGYYPFIDLSTGGSIDGAIRLANAALEHVTDKTIIIPGHGPVGDRAQLIEFRDMLVAIRENVARLKKQGKSLDEVIAAKPTAAFDAKWGGFVIDPAFFTRLVYAGAYDRDDQ